MKKITNYILGLFFGTLMLGNTAFAAETEYTVTPASAIGYTTENTIVKVEATENGMVVLNQEQCPDSVALTITGVTSTGYWEVDLGQPNKFYIIGAELENITVIGEAAKTTDTAEQVNQTAVQTNTQATEDVDAVLGYIIAQYKNRWGVNTITDRHWEEGRRIYRIYEDTLAKCMSLPESHKRDLISSNEIIYNGTTEADDIGIMIWEYFYDKYAGQYSFTDHYFDTKILQVQKFEPISLRQK